MTYSIINYRSRKSQGVGLREYHRQVIFCFLAVRQEIKFGMFPTDEYIRDRWREDWNSYDILHELLEHRKAVSNAF
jgi:hypothetical protein